MILERRAYTPRPGGARRFIDAQKQSGYPDMPISPNKLCYFNAVSGPSEQIVHYWAYENLNEWQERYALLYSHEKVQEYLQVIRPNFLKQGYEFFTPSPLPELCPYFRPDTWWKIGDAPILKLEEHCETIVEEQVISLNPGALPHYWDAYREFGLDASAQMPGGLIGGFQTLLGEQYKVLLLRWYEYPSQLIKTRADLNENPQWRAFQDAINPLVSAQHTQLIAPWPIPQMAPIFY